MPYPPFIDLDSLAGSLKTGKHATLHKMLDQAWRAESCLSDLKQSQDCSDALRERRASKAEDLGHDGLVVERSLMTTAVLLYARGTSTSGGKAGERGSIQLERGQLTKEQWQDHQTLLATRNQVMAHVNREHALDDRIWHRAILFAVKRPQGYRIAAATNETSFHKLTHERLDRMLPVAHAIVQSQFDKRIAAVSKALNEAQIPESEYLKHRFDPLPAFGSELAVQTIVNGAGTGSTGFWFSED